VAVVWVRRDEVAYPPRRRAQLARGALADELQVRRQLAARLHIDIDAVKVALHEGDEARELGPVVCSQGRRRGGGAVRSRVLLPVDDLVDGHQRILVLDGACGARRAAEDVGCRGARHGAPRGPRLEGVLAEVELLGSHGVDRVRRLHVLVDLGYGDVEVEIERQDGARDEDNEDGERGVLEIRNLDLHGPELDAPPDIVVGRRRLEAHVLPVGGLDVLKVVRLGQVQFFQVLGKDDDGVADEEVRKVRREPVVHAPIQKLLLDGLVDDEVLVEVLGPQARVGGDVCRVGGVAGFGYPPPVVLEGLDGVSIRTTLQGKFQDGHHSPSLRVPPVCDHLLPG